MLVLRASTAVLSFYIWFFLCVRSSGYSLFHSGGVTLNPPLPGTLLSLIANLLSLIVEFFFFDF